MAGPLERLRAWFRRGRPQEAPHAARRGPVDHVVVLDGTMSTLRPGYETNAGLTWKLLRETGPRHDLSLRYEPGIQWTSWRSLRDVVEGRGLDRQILHAYGALASRWRPGDRIFLFGYSRGAYAARSLAGVIGRVGLLRQRHATERNVTLAWRHYRAGGDGPGVQAFREGLCNADVSIEMIGIWDTVKALGIRAPIVWRWSQMPHLFHDHSLGPLVRHGYHALALDETRVAYAPVLWEPHPDFGGACEQVWFRGTHGDVGGQIDGREETRPLSNIPLVWMMEKAEALGLPLPAGWRDRFPQDVNAPSVGTMQGWGKLMIVRRRRRVGTYPTESVHPSVVVPWRVDPRAEPLGAERRAWR